MHSLLGGVEAFCLLGGKCVWWVRVGTIQAGVAGRRVLGVEADLTRAVSGLG